MPRWVDSKFQIYHWIEKNKRESKVTVSSNGSLRKIRDWNSTKLCRLEKESFPRDFEFNGPSIWHKMFQFLHRYMREKQHSIQNHWLGNWKCNKRAFFSSDPDDDQRQRIDRQRTGPNPRDRWQLWNRIFSWSLRDYRQIFFQYDG